MKWKIKYLKSIQKDIKKISKDEQKKIRDYLEKRIAKLENPRQQGKGLKGTHSELWRYRVGSYRIICQIDDEEIIILVVRIGHRKDVYRGKI